MLKHLLLKSVWHDVGHKWGSYFIFTHTFLTGVMFDSCMPLVRCQIGQVYPALGVWGTLVCIEFLDDSNHPTMHKGKGASLQGRHPHITGIGVWCKKIEMICMHPFDGWWSLCQILPNRVGASPMSQSNRCKFLLLILCPGPIFGMLIQWALCLQLG